ncbi:MAG: hypothetical protein K8R67_15005 [Desulfobacteraceae bacterium]|nr:hypothetical protein [Desulfobacteraceae bacterium]
MKFKLLVLLVFSFFFCIPGISIAQNPKDLHISELEKGTIQLKNQVSKLKDDIILLKKQIKQHQNFIHDYTKARFLILSSKIVKAKKLYDDGPQHLNPFTEDYLATDLHNAVKETNIVRSDGYKFTNYYQLVEFIKMAEKEEPMNKQAVNLLSEDLKVSQKAYNNKRIQFKAYRNAYSERISRLAIEGFWQFQGNPSVIKVEGEPGMYGEGMGSYEYYGFLTKDHLKNIKKGMLVFKLNKANLKTPFYFTGKEYEYSFDRATGTLWETTYRDIRVKIDNKRMTYKSSKSSSSSSQSLILNKIANLKPSRGITYERPEGLFGQ